MSIKTASQLAHVTSEIRAIRANISPFRRGEHFASLIAKLVSILQREGYGYTVCEGIYGDNPYCELTATSSSLSGVCFQCGAI